MKHIKQQLDIGNLYNGGATAVDIVTRFPGRFESMHVKDEIKSAGGHEKYDSTILGAGIVYIDQSDNLNFGPGVLTMGSAYQ